MRESRASSLSAAGRGPALGDRGAKKEKIGQRHFLLDKLSKIWQNLERLRGGGVYIKTDEKNAGAGLLALKNLQGFRLEVMGISLKFIDFIDIFNIGANGLIFAL